MSRDEIVFYRIPQFWQSNIADRLKSRKTPAKPTIILSQNTDNISFSSSNYQQIVSEIHYQFPLFQERIADIREVGNWRKDHKTGVTSPLQFAGSINRQSLAEHGDVKYVAELSRFYHFPFLALEATLGRDPFNLEIIERQLSDWAAQNPFLYSIHWTSGLEVAIRTINLIHTYRVLHITHHLTQQLDQLIRQQVELSFDYLSNHLSQYSSANNHLIAELSALCILCSYFTSPKLDKALSKFKLQLFEEIDRQINDDGVNFELSTRYHAEVLDHISHALLFLKIADIETPDFVECKLGKAFAFITDTILPSGISTEFSDSDDGHLVYPYFDKNYCIYHSQYVTGILLHQIAHSTSLPLKMDARNYLLFGEAGSKQLQALEPKKETEKPGLKSYAKSGYYFLHDWELSAKISFDAGPIGDPITAAHGHSDLLHFIFEQHGFPYIIDPGTYQYHTAYSFWRKYFRGATAHNTIVVNRRNHATANNRMSWVNRPAISVLDTKETDHTLQCKAQHTAFEPVQHTRTISMLKERQQVLIIDSVTGAAEDDLIEFYLHFNPYLSSVKLVEDKIILQNEHKHVQLQNQFFQQASLLKGNEQQPLGWYSPSYDNKIACHTLQCPLPPKPELTITTTIDYSNG